MTPELRHGLYAVDPKELGGDKYEAEREQDRENEKARWVLYVGRRFGDV